VSRNRLLEPRCTALALPELQEYVAEVILGGDVTSLRDFIAAVEVGGSTASPC